MAGNTCLIIGDKDKVTYFFTETMRVNAAGGLAFNANIKATGWKWSSTFKEDKYQITIWNL